MAILVYFGLNCSKSGVFFLDTCWLGVLLISLPSIIDFISFPILLRRELVKEKGSWDIVKRSDISNMVHTWK